MKISVTSPASLKKTSLLFVPAFAGESVDLPTGVDVPHVGQRAALGWSISPQVEQRI